MSEYKTIEELIGKTITLLERSAEEVVITTKEGPRYRMYHSQDCCESVQVTDVTGIIDNILNSPVTDASENIGHDSPGCESATTTDYTITTDKGTIVIKWLGESNGYYSEEVLFIQI